MRFSVGLVLVAVGGAIIGAATMYFFLEVSPSSESVVKRPAPLLAHTNYRSFSGSSQYTSIRSEYDRHSHPNTDFNACRSHTPTDTIPESGRPEGL